VFAGFRPDGMPLDADGLQVSFPRFLNITDDAPSREDTCGGVFFVVFVQYLFCLCREFPSSLRDKERTAGAPSSNGNTARENLENAK
jgi:hypothetical protein